MLALRDRDHPGQVERIHRVRDPVIEKVERGIAPVIHRQRLAGGQMHRPEPVIISGGVRDEHPQRLQRDLEQREISRCRRHSQRHRRSRPLLNNVLDKQRVAATVGRQRKLLNRRERRRLGRRRQHSPSRPDTNNRATVERWRKRSLSRIGTRRALLRRRTADHGRASTVVPEHQPRPTTRSTERNRRSRLRPRRNLIEQRRIVRRPTNRLKRRITTGVLFVCATVLLKTNSSRTS